MPHYWFRIPLSTARHLKEAKERDGARGVRRELEKDVHARRMSLTGALFADDMSSCEALVFSVRPLTKTQCQELSDHWDIEDPNDAPCRPLLSTHEVDLGPPDGLQSWGPPSESGEPEQTQAP